MRIRIKGWEQFQHFKDRTPPWIKLYRHLLDDPDWHELDGKSAKFLMMLWLLASEDKVMEGYLPDIRTISFRLRVSEKESLEQINKLNHWLIIDDISAISERYQLDAPETETETETETAPKPESKKAEKNKGTRFALADPPGEWIQFCATQRPDLDPGATFDRFRDYWIGKPGKDGLKADWTATWRNWVRGEKSAPAKGNNYGQPTKDQRMRAALARSLASQGIDVTGGQGGGETPSD